MARAWMHFVRVVFSHPLPPPPLAPFLIFVWILGFLVGCDSIGGYVIL